MRTKDKLRLMREIERRNQQREEAFKSARNGTSQPRQKKTKRNKGKH